MYQPAYETAYRVNVYDGVSMHQVAARIFLTDAIPDDFEEQAMAVTELRRSGRYWVGGGSAPLFLLTLVR